MHIQDTNASDDTNKCLENIREQQILTSYKQISQFLIWIIKSSFWPQKIMKKLIPIATKYSCGSKWNLFNKA
jgi:hypothetical protein